jgi:hypothetical protein
MMKVKILVTALMLAGMAPAQADGQGAWVKVDSSGNAVGQAIVCTSDVCGDKSSPYAQATLGVGEQYVLQAQADPVTNNVAGIGNNNPNTQVQVNIPTQEWTITRTNTAIPETPVLINGQLVTSYTYQTVERFTPNTAPWIYTKEPMVVEVDPGVDEVVAEASVKTKMVKAKKAKVKAKKKAVIK